MYSRNQCRADYESKGSTTGAPHEIVSAGVKVFVKDVKLFGKVGKVGVKLLGNFTPFSACFFDWQSVPLLLLYIIGV